MDEEMQNMVTAVENCFVKNWRAEFILYVEEDENDNSDENIQI